LWTVGLDVSSGVMPKQQITQNGTSSAVSEVVTARSDPESSSSSGKHVQGSKLVATNDGAIDSTPSQVTLSLS